MKKSVLCISLLFAFITLSAQNLDSMLLLYYPFTGNANDASGNNYHGTVSGATLTTDRFGNPNSAYYFNGTSSYINLPNNPALKPPLPVTISFWVNIEDINSLNPEFITTDYNPNSYSGVFMNIEPSQKRVQLHYGDGTPNTTTPSQRRSKVGTTSLVANTWYLITGIVRGPSNMDIYINCINDGGTYTGSGGNLFYSANPGTIGRNDVAGMNPYHFKGKLDEIRYWNRALTPLEVQMLCGVMASAGPNQTMCEGQSVMIGGNPSAQNGSAPYTYAWSPTAGLNDPYSANPIASPTVNTTYTLTVTDYLGSTSTSTVNVTVNPLPSVNLGPDILMCNNASATLDAGPGFASYLWSTSQNSQSVAVFNSGAYSVTVTNSFGCPASDSVNVTLSPNPVVNIGPDITICVNEPETLDAGAGFTSYLWSTSETDQTILVSSSGTFSVTVSNIYGCTASDAINVTGISQYDATILPPWQFCHHLTSVQLVGATQGGVWSGPGIINEPSGIFSPFTAGIGDHTITYSIDGACGNSDTAVISVIDCTVPEPHVYIPNVFSPNGDGINDEFCVKGEEIAELEFLVFNRWGEKIFESHDLNHGWDGTFKGTACMSGVYTYMAYITFSNNQKVVRSGSVTLVR